MLMSFVCVKILARSLGIVHAELSGRRRNLRIGSSNLFLVL
jgi:hypothetical protein